MFALEYDYEELNVNIQDRIWSVLPENLKILNDKNMGSVLRVLGLETARVYRLYTILLRGVYDDFEKKNRRNRYI